MLPRLAAGRGWSRSPPKNGLFLTIYELLKLTSGCSIQVHGIHDSLFLLALVVASIFPYRWEKCAFLSALASSCAARVTDSHCSISPPGSRTSIFFILRSGKCNCFLDPISLFLIYLWSSLTLLEHILKQVLRKSTKEKNFHKTWTFGNSSPDTWWLTGRVFCAQNALLTTLKLSSIVFLPPLWLMKGCCWWDTLQLAGFSV